MSIGSNVKALRTQRMLGQTGAALAHTFERLSSGLRINKASDDAAGLAIAESLRTDSRLFNAAIRNVQDGISRINIAESALGTQIEIITRLQELATQAASGSLSEEQRSTLNTEYQALLSEYRRVADSTTFNDQKLLSAGRNGGSENIILQTGIDGSVLSTLSIDSPDTSFLYGNLTNLIEYDDGGAAMGLMILDPMSLDDIVSAGGKILYYPTSHIPEGTGDSAMLVVWGIETTMSVNGGVLFSLLVPNEEPGLYNALSGHVAGLNSSGQIIDLSSFESFYNLDMSEMHFYSDDSVESTAIDFTGTESALRAQEAITYLSDQLSRVATLRGELGASISRLEVSSNVLSISRENYLSAESRIRDVDIAEEVAVLVRNQILQQAAVEVHALSQEQPRVLLRLLAQEG